MPARHRNPPSPAATEPIDWPNIISVDGHLLGLAERTEVPSTAMVLDLKGRRVTTQNPQIRAIRPCPASGKATTEWLRSQAIAAPHHRLALVDNRPALVPAACTSTAGSAPTAAKPIVASLEQRPRQ